MNCTICGGPFILGTDAHKNCEEIRRQRSTRDQEIDEMLAWYREIKEKGYIPPPEGMKDHKLYPGPATQGGGHF